MNSCLSTLNSSQSNACESNQNNGKVVPPLKLRVPVNCYSSFATSLAQQTMSSLSSQPSPFPLGTSCPNSMEQPQAASNCTNNTMRRRGKRSLEHSSGDKCANDRLILKVKRDADDHYCITSSTLRDHNEISPPARVNKDGKSNGKGSQAEQEFNALPKCSSCRLSDGTVFHIGDIVWAKIQGYPFWPARIMAIAQPHDKEFRCCVDWLAWKQHSFLPCNKLLHFQKHFDKKFSPKNKRMLYLEAVQEAKAAVSQQQQQSSSSLLAFNVDSISCTADLNYPSGHAIPQTSNGPDAYRLPMGSEAAAVSNVSLYCPPLPPTTTATKPALSELHDLRADFFDTIPDFRFLAFLS